MSFSTVAGLLSYLPSARTWRHLEALAHASGAPEPKHPLGAPAASRQADRRVSRAGRSDRTVGPPDVRTRIGAGPGGRRARLPGLLRPGVGVTRCPRAP